MSIEELSNEQRNVIKDGFETLGISQNSYPTYNDPYVLASTFEVCSLYENVPLTSDSCADCREVTHAKLERGS